MDYVQDVELQRDEACQKRVFFPQKQWDESINLRGWSLFYLVKGLCFSTEGWNLHPAQSPARTALCSTIYSITYSSEQDIHLRSKVKSQVAGGSSLCFLWTLVLQNKPVSAGEIYVGWKRVAGMSVAKGAASLRQGWEKKPVQNPSGRRWRSFLSLLSFRFQREGRKRKILGISLLRKGLKLYFSI